MPYSVQHQDGQWVVVKKATGKVVSRHATREKAEASVRAVYAHEDKSHWWYRKGRQ